MKKLYSLLFLLTVAFGSSFATIHVVSVSNNTFSPASLNANVGDTIRFSRVAGNHTSTSSTIPTGAAAWDVTLSQPGQTFDYVPTVAGTYNYVCSFHSGMAGSFTVASGTSIAKSVTVGAMTAYPNPFKDRITVSHSSSDMITVYNVMGGLVLKSAIETSEVKSVLDLSILPSGVYFLNTLKDGQITGTRRIVKS